MNTISSETHVAIMARMVLKAEGQKLGRTQLMKLCYFLQEIEQVPIQYDFRLFNYGPFDSEVLSDLGTACSHDALKEETVPYPRGYGYKITPGDTASELSDNLESEDPELASKIDQIVQAFSGETAGELELQSTIIFVDREQAREQQLPTEEFITDRVHSIKPHFPKSVILARIKTMKAQGYMLSLSA